MEDEVEESENDDETVDYGDGDEVEEADYSSGDE